MVSKGLQKGLVNVEIRRIEIIPTQHCLDWIEYWEQSWRPEETCCHSDSNERPPANNNDEIGNQRKNQDHPDLSIVEISQNTENVPKNYIEI